MNPIRVLIVDDSPTARELLVSVCRQDPGLEVVGEAADGEAAVALALRLRPDIVVMDVHMPRLDGLAATRRIMQEHPMPVLAVTATLRPDDVSLAMRAMEAGAVSVVQKPSGLDDTSVTHGVATFRRKVRSLAAVRVIRRYEPHPRRPARRLDIDGGQGAAAGRAMGVVASTGGPVALRDLLCHLPASFPAPIAVVQHIAVGFLPGFASWLESSLHLEVRIAEHGDAFLPGSVYLAPDDHHLVIAPDRTLRLDAGPPVGGFRPSGSALLSSLASVYGREGLGVILTGLGNDGLAGMRALREAGGSILAQSLDTAVAPSMPGSVIREDLADAVGPVHELADHLVTLCAPGKDTA